jgi:N-acetylglucosamine malate deacetylase 1
MKKQIVIVAPHPDDETLGCGGTILRHKQAGEDIHWLVVTAMTPEQGFSRERIAEREAEIASAALRYGFASVKLLGFPTTRLDTLPMGDLIAAVSAMFQTVAPEIIYLPFAGDVHSDHAIVSDAVVSCTKWFRYPSIKRILAYETLSETEFGISPVAPGFRPNVFVDIHPYLNEKIEILKIFSSELGEFPFPRSIEAVRALALLRGTSAGCEAAEAFMLLKEIE